MNEIYFLLIFLMIVQLNLVKTEDEEDDPNKPYYIHYDLTEPDIIYIPNKENQTEIKDIISKDSSNTLSDVKLDKIDGFFSGWTDDWVYGYEAGDVFQSKKKNVTLYPVFGLLEEKTTYTLEYVVEFEGEFIEHHINRGRYVKNRIVATSMLTFPNTKASHRGWTDGKNEFVHGQKLVMPAHNVTLRAIYHYYRTLTYSCGDVDLDEIVGIQNDIQIMSEGGMKDLAEETRLKRKGYNMVCWHCENDGLDYPFFFQYIMPDEDVIMTAVWAPMTYTIVFDSGDKSIPNIKIKGKTDTYIYAPNIETEREDFIFEGWRMYNNMIFYPGDEIRVIGQTPPFGITAQAIWVPK